MVEDKKRPLDHDFAERLKKLMEDSGFSTKERKIKAFAEAIGRKDNWNVVYEWVRGRVPGYPEDIKILKDFFGVTADYLLFGNNGKTKESKEHVIKIVVDSKFLEKELLGERRQGVRRKEDKIIFLLLSRLLKARVGIKGRPEID